jgi:hypothetical protein
MGLSLHCLQRQDTASLSRDLEAPARRNLLRLQGYESDTILDLESCALARDGEVAYIEVLFLVATVLSLYE